MSSVDDETLRRLAAAAGDGDDQALEQLVAGVHDDVYRLALRMLWHPEDAQDATQEALIRIVTRVGSYRGDAAFRTWAYRVAANQIINWRQSRVEQENLNFRRFAEDLHEGLTDPSPSEPDADLLVEEVKLGCTLGMLLCLDREHRLAYVLSDVFEISSEEAGYICSTTPAAFRKRASRARAQLRDFVSQHCGLVNRSSPCRCDRRVAQAVRIGRINSHAPLFASRSDTKSAVEEMEKLYDLSSLMRSHPAYQAPTVIRATIRKVIAAGDYHILD